MASYCQHQRWSRGHKARAQGQGHKKNPRPRIAFPRTDTLEAKDQGHKRKCSPKKKVFKKFFRQSPKKKSSQKFFRQSPQKNVFQKFFQALHKILTIQRIVLSSSRGQANFRGLEAKAKDFKMCPRGLHLWPALCPILPARDLKLSPQATETNALPLDQLDGAK